MNYVTPRSAISDLLGVAHCIDAEQELAWFGRINKFPNLQIYKFS